MRLHANLDSSTQAILTQTLSPGGRGGKLFDNMKAMEERMRVKIVIKSLQ
jgi:hypothetical protein